MSKIRFVLAVLFLGLCTAWLTGCETTDTSDDYDPKPWTPKAEWEDNFGIPF